MLWRALKKREQELRWADNDKAVQAGMTAFTEKIPTDFTTALNNKDWEALCTSMLDPNHAAAWAGLPAQYNALMAIIAVHLPPQKQEGKEATLSPDVKAALENAKV